MADFFMHAADDMSVLFTTAHVVVMLQIKQQQIERSSKASELASKQVVDVAQNESASSKQAANGSSRNGNGQKKMSKKERQRQAAKSK